MIGFLIGIAIGFVIGVFAEDRAQEIRRDSGSTYCESCGKAIPDFTFFCPGCFVGALDSTKEELE